MLHKYHDLQQWYLLFLRRQNLLNAHLINQVISFQISEMRPLFIICQVRANPVGHYQNESSIIHVQPIASSNELVRSVPRERAIWLSAKVGFVEAGHGGDRCLACSANKRSYYSKKGLTRVLTVLTMFS